MQVDNWLHQRPFDAPAEKGQQAQGPVIVIGAGPAGLAAANHLKVGMCAICACTCACSLHCHYTVVAVVLPLSETKQCIGDGHL